MSSSEYGSTPPHHPTYNVRLSSETIQRIIATACPGQRIVSIETLLSGKSFNNRIYFVDLSRKDRHAPYILDRDLGEGVPKQSLVLKVSGQFFGPDKVQNEVSCLALLEKHCPDIPVPRVVAWSDDELAIRQCKSANLLTPEPVSKQDYSHLPGTYTSGRGWILMTRQPGRLIGVEDLQGPHTASLMRQLAGYTAQWRQQMPRADRIGNMKDIRDISGGQNYDHDIYESFQDKSLDVTIDGLLYCHYLPKGPITCSLDYYRIQLEDQLKKLETEQVFSAARHQVSPLVRNFIAKTLPRLSLFTSDKSEAIKFTHYDFSPRNILVSEGSPPSISGILDFEFAGFFPEEEEFTNNAIANANDWPEPAYRIFLEELERLGVNTPVQGIDQSAWKEACKLVQIARDVAPWYLREGGTKGPELETELNAAAERVKTSISEVDAEIKC